VNLCAIARQFSTAFPRHLGPFCEVKPSPGYLPGPGYQPEAPLAAAMEDGAAEVYAVVVVKRLISIANAFSASRSCCRMFESQLGSSQSGSEQSSQLPPKHSRQSH